MKGGIMRYFLVEKRGFDGDHGHGMRGWRNLYRGGLRGDVLQGVLEEWFEEKEDGTSSCDKVPTYLDVMMN